MKKNPMHVNRVEARKILGGVADRTFAKLEADGILTAFRRGRGRLPSIYDLAVLVPQYVKYARTTSPTGGDRDARARRDLSQAELNELRLQERRKELLPRDEVVRDGQAFIVATRAKLLALPRRLAQGGHIQAETAPAVATIIREVLEEMARWKTKLDLDAAVRKSKGAEKH